jgi:hypothetical protein
MAAGGGYYDNYSIGVKNDGSLWAWGTGRLGLGGEQDRTNVPPRIGTDTDWAVPAPPVGELRITSLGLAGGRAQVSFTHTNYRAYYVLYRGAEPANIQQPVQARLARFPPMRMTDPTPGSSNASSFYRIRAVPKSQPLDLDGDGIDDYYELRHAGFLNPFNAADATQDDDGDGRSNLQEYREGLDPAHAEDWHPVAAGLGHTAVLKTDGSLRTWGDNFDGQLGDGTTNQYRRDPVRVGTGNDWISVAAGFYAHTVGLKRDGSLWAWGLGTNGEPVFVPSRVGNDTDWAAIAAGFVQSLARKRDGTLWAWGWGSGLGNSPTRVAADRWTSFAAAGAPQFVAFVVALQADGSLWSLRWDDPPARIGTDTDWGSPP